MIVQELNSLSIVNDTKGWLIVSLNTLQPWKHYVIPTKQGYLNWWICKFYREYIEYILRKWSFIPTIFSSFFFFLFSSSLIIYIVMLWYKLKKELITDQDHICWCIPIYPLSIYWDALFSHHAPNAVIQLIC